MPIKTAATNSGGQGALDRGSLGGSAAARSDHGPFGVGFSVIARSWSTPPPDLTFRSIRLNKSATYARRPPHR
jgi:hypothetical protein